MNEIAVLSAMKAVEVRNRLRHLGRQSRFKLVILAAFSVVFWWSLYKLFSQGLRFLYQIAHQYYFEDLIGSMFYIFFFALTVMLVFSNAVIGYTAYFHSKETGFLFSNPVRFETIFLYKFAESLTFSSWAFLFLGTPLMAAFGSLFDRPWYFYAGSILFFIAFMFIPAAIGSILAMLIVTYIPRTRKGLLTLFCTVVTAGLILLASKILTVRVGPAVDIRLAMEVFESIGFSRNPILPSYWISRGILALTPDETRTALLFFGVILANSLFLMAIAYGLSSRLLGRGWFVAQGLRRSRKVPARGIIDKVFAGILSWVNPRVRYIVIKDVKSFVRDPVQWSQFVIFFGLLGLYIANLRTFAYEERDVFWKNLVAQMNLLATSLTLATFAGRFIFPQLSLEGRRFWIIGMVPMEREKILYGKLALSFSTSLMISELLIGVSSAMLRTPPALAILHSVALVGICLGLSGMAVGLGAIYPNFSEDNPSKIVSGFGGTLNLVLSLAFVFAILAAQAVPCFLYFGPRMISPSDFRGTVALSLGAIGVLSLVAGLVPMSLGLRAVRRMEV